MVGDSLGLAVGLPVVGDSLGLAVGLPVVGDSLGLVREDRDGRRQEWRGELPEADASTTSGVLHLALTTKGRLMHSARSGKKTIPEAEQHGGEQSEAQCTRDVDITTQRASEVLCTSAAAQSFARWREKTLRDQDGRALQHADQGGDDNLIQPATRTC